MTKIKDIKYHEDHQVYDKLYSDSKNNKSFQNLIKIIISEENIIKAFHNLKKTSNRPGVDSKDMSYLENLDIEKVFKIISSKANDYKPKAIIKESIIKIDGTKRVIGIPSILDKLFEQCIKQVLEPICEAKFYNHSYGLRPTRHVEDAIGRTYFLMQKNKLPNVVSFDLNDFVENVNQNMLVKQLWNLKIRDKKLISIIKAMFKAEIIEHGKRYTLGSGIFQCGILCPLFINVSLNELDWWISSQWETLPTKKNYQRIRPDKNNCIDDSNRVTELKRTTNLKEVHIVRFGESFRIFCRNYKDSKSIEIATIEWLKIRLGIDNDFIAVKNINLKTQRMEFLGFEMRLHKKSNKYVVQSHISEYRLGEIKKQLKNQISDIKTSKTNKSFYEKINEYNAIVIGIHNFYKYATDVSIDLRKTGLEIDKILYNRLKNSFSIEKSGKIDTNSGIIKRYAESKQIRYINERPIIPISFIKTKPPLSRNQKMTPFSEEGRKLLEGRINNNSIVKHLLSQPLYEKSAELVDSEISNFYKQKGFCYVTEKQLTIENMHCHHKKPKNQGGTDDKENIVLITKEIHILVHATNIETINKYMYLISNEKQLKRLNKPRRFCGLKNIEAAL